MHEGSETGRDLMHLSNKKKTQAESVKKVASRGCWNKILHGLRPWKGFWSLSKKHWEALKGFK